METAVGVGILALIGILFWLAVKIDQGMRHILGKMEAIEEQLNRIRDRLIAIEINTEQGK